MSSKVNNTTIYDILKNMYIVETRDAGEFLVVRGIDFYEGYSKDFIVSFSDKDVRSFDDFDKYTLKATEELGSRYDIMKVTRPEFLSEIAMYFTIATSTSDTCFTDKYEGTPVWERQDVREMTVAEIEKELGCRIKIIKEK